MSLLNITAFVATRCKDAAQPHPIAEFEFHRCHREDQRVIIDVTHYNGDNDFVQIPISKLEDLIVALQAAKQLKRRKTHA